MSAADQQLAQFAGIFCQVGYHDKHPWVPLPWKGVFNKVLYFDPSARGASSAYNLHLLIHRSGSSRVSVHAGTLEFASKLKTTNFISHRK
jgi:hypothetical protein